MKKQVGKVLKTLGIVILVALVLLLQVSSSFAKQNGTNSGEYFFEESISNEDARVVDIAMLGAHDAFTSELSRGKGGNVHEGGITNNKLVNILAGGLVTRLAKAQSASAMQMLIAGVRYFDVRVTRIDGKYYAFHGYLSGELTQYVQDIVDFLGTHPYEFVIFDIQHYMTENGENFGLPDSDYVELLEYLNSIKNSKGKSLLDYVFYDVSEKSLSDLTYKDVKGGVVMLGKMKASKILYERDGDANYDDNRQYSSIYSYWINHNDTDIMLEKMAKTMAYVSNRTDLNKVLRVNQAQKTGFFTDSRIVKSLFGWSLLDMAADFNMELTRDSARLQGFLKACPILMVDNATSTKGNFNIDVIDILKDYNQGL